MKNVTDLYHYKVSLMSHAERYGLVLISQLTAKRVQDPTVKQLLHDIEGDGARHLENLEECIDELHTVAMEVQPLTVDGLRSEFEHFLRMQIDPKLTDLYALDVVTRFICIAVASYRHLIGWAISLKLTKGIQALHTNLVEKELGASRLRRASHRLVEATVDISEV